MYGGDLDDFDRVKNDGVIEEKAKKYTLRKYCFMVLAVIGQIVVLGLLIGVAIFYSLAPNSKFQRNRICIKIAFKFWFGYKNNFYSLEFGSEKALIAETAEKISNTSTLPQNYNHEYFINGVFILVVATVVCYCFGFTKGYSTWLEQKKILSGDTGISEVS